uniref:tRNA(Ile)-lysidine synthase, chloroplastic n=1 Tax=Melanothamnus harveyi TaxID=397005 RepID=A0A1Z1MH39_MELHR|nr:tRNA Ile-lysidine synthetase [Melanothamnus harveyi]ARW65323.1 tRNA Ile-lysidine synthetase [Melanothamnus harveyi]
MLLRPLKKVFESIENFIMQKKIKSIIVAISGGQDSILLLKIFDELKHKLPTIEKISYIYIDHQWKANSYKHIQHLINHIKSYKKNLIIYQICKNINSENECRKQRYNLIHKHAHKYKYELIITGHNSSDKIETSLQNINRSSGQEGLSSPVIANQTNDEIFLLRPMLEIDKEKVYFLCKKLNLPIWSDSTNYIYHIERNRLRYELIPYVRNFFSKKVEQNILLSTKNHYYENEYIKQNANKLYLNSKHKNRIAINYQYISRQHLILQIKTLQIFYMYNINIKIHSNVVKKIINQMNKKKKEKKIVFEDQYYKHIINNQWLYIEMKVK